MSFRPTLAATLALVPALAILVGLGVWQLERREWKHALISQVERGLAEEPMDLVGALTASGIELDYAHVEVDGDIAAKPVAHLFAPTGQGAADYRVIAPLDYGGGRKILVDLGSISEGQKTQYPDSVPPSATGPRHIEGILRPTEEPGMFTAAPDLKGNRWYIRDVPAMAAALNLPNLPLYVLQSDQPNPGDIPHAIPFRPDLPDNHLQYALTWFALAAMLAGFYVAVSRKRDSATRVGHGVSEQADQAPPVSPASRLVHPPHEGEG